MRLDADLPGPRAKEIRDALDVLDRYRQLSLEEFLAREEAIHAATYRLLVAIEAAVSMCKHLATRITRRTPESHAQVISWERVATTPCTSGSVTRASRRGEP